MELEIPQPSHTLTRTQKQAIIRSDFSSPLYDSRLKRIIRQKSIIPSHKVQIQAQAQTQNQSEIVEQEQPAAEQPSVELPPIQAMPTPAIASAANRRKRASSTGNDGRPSAVSQPPVEMDRPTAPLKSRIELTPIAAGQSKSQVKEEYSIQLKNSIRNVELKHFQQEQTRNKLKEEPLKSTLSKVFPNEKKREKDPKRMSFSTVVESGQKAPNEAVESVLPRIRPEIKPKDLVFGPNVKKDIMVKHYNEVMDGVNYAMHQMKPLPVFQIRSLQVSLKRKNDALQKTLVLDMDETLVHARKEDYDNKMNLPYINGGGDCFFGIEIRPYAEEFLKEMSKEFEIIIFTAAEKEYAKNILALLDPDRQYISHLLHRSHCLRTKRGLFIKDLRILVGRELKDMVIVDNFTPSFSFQIDNGIPIITWTGDRKDQELKYLMNYLLEAKKYNDMRQYNKEKLRLEELGQI